MFVYSTPDTWKGIDFPGIEPIELRWKSDAPPEIKPIVVADKATAPWVRINAFHQFRLGEETSMRLSVQTWLGQFAPQYMPDFAIIQIRNRIRRTGILRVHS